MSPQPHIHLSLRPAPPLARYIEQVWYWEGPMASHTRDRILPSGCASLIINLAEDEVRDYVGKDHSQIARHPGAVLVGAYSKFTVIDSSEQRAVIGVDFKPGGMAPFFDSAADELHNTHVGLRDVWGERGHCLREQVLHEQTPANRLQRVLRELARRARPLEQRAEVDFLIAQLTMSPHQSVADLSERAGLSARRISRLFALQTGLTPKLFARIKRFEQVLRCMHTQERHWSEIAQHCGYFDQSHLIHECRELSGCTPEELQSRRLGLTRHIPL